MKGFTLKKLGLRVLVAVLIASCLLTSSVLFANLFGPSKASLGFIGDIMMHYRVKGCARVMNVLDENGESTNNGGHDYLYAQIAPRLKSVDLMSGNMEFPVSPPFIQKHIIFNAPSEAIGGIRDAGFDLVSLANNHILDQGIDGLHNTISYLEDYKLPYFGVARSESEARGGVVKNIHGVRIGIIAYAGLVNYPERNTSEGFYLNWIYDKEKVLEDIAAIKNECDFLVLQVHTGVEYVIEPREYDRELYKEYAEAGVDLIIGHHPHMLHYMEQHLTQDGRSVSIFHSLGNFISDQNKQAAVYNTGMVLTTRDSAMVECRVTKNWGELSHSIRVIALHTFHEYKLSDEGRYKDIQTVAIPDKLQSLQSKLDAVEAGSGEEKKLQQEIRFFESRRRAIKKTLFPDDVPEGLEFL